MSKLLVVEDSRLFGSVVKRRIQGNTPFEVTWTQTYAEALQAIETSEEEYLLAILDLNLPDSPDGEVLDGVRERGIPIIVSTASFDEEMRTRIWAKGIVDYVLKESSHGVDYMVRLVNRIWRNQTVEILVVDDLKTARLYVERLLKLHCYQVHEAADGEEALAILDANPNISLMITDYNMPVMDGFQLVDKVRRQKTREDLAIIGMSGEEGSALTARFLKTGANDFLQKPFSSEEFYCRVALNVEMIEYSRELRPAVKTAEINLDDTLG